MNVLHSIDLLIIAAYFVAMAWMGWAFSRRTKTAETYFVGHRSYPGWVAGVSLFGAQISSITFIAYPADAYKTAWLRFLICLSLPVAVWIATRFLLPFFRRDNCTSLFEYLEARFGPRTRVYGASVFILSQCIRISLIQYLVALLMHNLTGWSIETCILLGGVVTAYYTIVGGFEAVVWTDVVQSILLTAGGLMILGVILWKLPGGLGQLVSVAVSERKFLFGELGADGGIHAIPWGLSLTHKTFVMLLIVGVSQWLTDYVTNQEVVQRYCAAKSTTDARRAIWICCWTALPTWGYFMLIGTGLFVFYRVFPDPRAAAMLNGGRKAEEILPFFITTQLGPGLVGLVIASVLGAAMSSMSSAMNSISAVGITDIYRRHLARGRDEAHYVRAAKNLTLASSLIMVGGAWLLFRTEMTTLQDLWTEFQSILGGGLLGFFLLGFLTTRVDGRAVGAGIVCSLAFSTWMSGASLGWLPAGWISALQAHFDIYYAGVAGNLLAFGIGFLFATLFPRAPRPLAHLTLWTQTPSRSDESTPLPAAHDPIATAPNPNSTSP